MPTVSKKQEKFMQAVANNPKFAKKVGVNQSIGREFTKENGMKKNYMGGGKVKKMRMGGNTSRDNKLEELGRVDNERADTASGARNLKDEKRRIRGELGMKKGGKVKKQGYNARLDESLGMRKGKKKQSMKARRDESKGMKKAAGKKAYSGNRSSAKGSASKRADGIARKGRTKGRMV